MTFNRFYPAGVTTNLKGTAGREGELYFMLRRRRTERELVFELRNGVRESCSLMCNWFRSWGKFAYQFWNDFRKPREFDRRLICWRFVCFRLLWLLCSTEVADKNCWTIIEHWIGKLHKKCRNLWRIGKTEKSPYNKILFSNFSFASLSIWPYHSSCWLSIPILYHLSSICITLWKNNRY